MTKEESRLLRDVINHIIKKDPHLWNSLKREIFDFGFQLEYENLINYIDIIEREVFLMSPSIKRDLLNEWARQKNNCTLSQFHTNCTMLILEEVRRRATIAVRSTINWD